MHTLPILDDEYTGAEFAEAYYYKTRGKGQLI
jgi:hypothetical protein